MAFVHSVFSKSLIVICVLLLACASAQAQTTPTTNQSGEQEERPVSYGLVIDASGSMRAIFEQVVATARSVIKANRSGDKTFVVHYVDADTIEFDTGLTTDQESLEQALDGLYVEGGLTATLDALHRALDFVQRAHADDTNAPPRSRALVLITDGEDRGSQLSNPEALLSRLRQSDVRVYVIGLTDLVKKASNRKQAVSLLTRIAETSGGRVFFPKSFAEMPELLKDLTRDLHKK
jgi:Ca-activated chloride channel homolog